ncbi:uncharacterized protein LOC123316885 isoform X2 [Coccinella septempunctata]|nr:uncharacterized protein LOC123316885 isoform X2 [Coccinella septempunctata]
MYCAVEFRAKEGRSAPCSIVPLLWLNSNNTLVYWPPTVSKKKFEEMVRKQAPCDLTWKTYQIKKVLFKSSSYEEAELRLERFQSSSEESEFSNIEPIIPNLLEDMYHKDSDDESVLMNARQNDDLAFSDSFTKSVLDACTSSSIPKNSEKIEKSIEEIAKEVAKISTVQEQLLLMLNNIASTLRNEPYTIEQSPNCPNFPIGLEEEFFALEDFIKNPEHEKFMVTRLKSIGGNSAEDHTRRILRFLMRNELACLFNWRGTDKKPFRDTKIMQIIYVAVKKEFSSATDSQIEVATKDWLKFAKKRLNDAKKRLA